MYTLLNVANCLGCYRELARAQNSLGLFKEAIKNLEYIIDLNPDDTALLLATYATLTDSQLNLGLHKEAWESNLRLIDLVNDIDKNNLNS